MRTDTRLKEHVSQGEREGNSKRDMVGLGISNVVYNLNKPPSL